MREPKGESPRRPLAPARPVRSWTPSLALSNDSSRGIAVTVRVRFRSWMRPGRRSGRRSLRGDCVWAMRSQIHAVALRSRRGDRWPVTRVLHLECRLRPGDVASLGWSKLPFGICCSCSYGDAWQGVSTRRISPGLVARRPRVATRAESPQAIEWAASALWPTNHGSAVGLTARLDLRPPRTRRLSRGLE
jgi:hypothetical protein